MKRRNLAILLLCGLAFGGLAGARHTRAAEVEEGFTNLFNGVDLRGWLGNVKFWSVQEGALTGRTTKENPTPGNTFLIWQGGEVGDFVLRLSYRVAANNDRGFANSGIQYRSRVLNRTTFAVGGYQADLEAGPTYSGILYDEGGVAGGRGIMANRGEKVVWDQAGNKQAVEILGRGADLQQAIKPGEWNEYEITAEGCHFVHKINGVTMVDVTDHCADKRLTSGVLALQLHAGEPMTAQFKNIRLKRLPTVKKIVLIAGRPSHGPGDHEHRAGCLLLQKCLAQVPGITTVVVTNGWPSDVSVFDDAAALAIYSDGGGGHPFVQGERLKEIAKLMRRGVGLGCIHYAVEVPKDKGGVEFLAWIGGYFETYYSVNPHWEADFKVLPNHAITRGVRPFKINDEWYYHMRFLENSPWLVRLLSAAPPDSTRGKPGQNDPHGGNPEVQKHMGQIEHVMWAVNRPDTGRGFGFTGGHFHKNWGDDNFRKIILNALLWIAKADVPPNGVESTVTEEDLKANLDPK
jgi:type 1 glutamine amidotransferase